MTEKVKKVLGLRGIIISGLSGAIGFEIFVLLNYAYFNLAGTSIIFALALGGIINLIIMLCYSELGAALPFVGGEYSYIKKAYGGYVGFIFGCFSWLASIFAAALAAITFVSQFAYLTSVFSVELQSTIMNSSWIFAIIIVAFMGFMEIRGLRKISSLIVIAFVILFAVFIIGGLLRGIGQIDLSLTTMPIGASGIFAATVYIFPIFIGTKALIANAPNAAKPGKDIPRALILSAIIIIPLYLLIALVAVGTVGWSTTQDISLLNQAANIIFGDYGSIVFAFAGMIACLSALGTALSVQSSNARGMSVDGYFPKKLLSVHPRYGTFYFVAIVGSLFIMALSTLGEIPFLGYAASFGSLLVFALVNLSLIKLRKTQPFMDRPFKTPLYPITPILGIVLSFAMLATPVLLGDANAIEALTSSLGLTAIVVMAYYLRMAGKVRIQIALGGIEMGTGFLITLISSMELAGILQPIFPFIPTFIELLFAIVLIVVGFYSFTVNYSKKENEKKDKKQTKISGLGKRLFKRF